MKKANVGSLTAMNATQKATSHAVAINFMERAVTQQNIACVMTALITAVYTRSGEILEENKNGDMMDDVVDTTVYLMAQLLAM